MLSSGSSVSHADSSTASPQAGRPRRRRPILVAAAVVAGMMAATGAGAFLGDRNADREWQPRYKEAVTESAHWKSESKEWQRSSKHFRGELRSLRKQVVASVGDIDSPHFSLWNSCSAAGPDAGCPLTPGQEYVGGVPDTFTYHVSFRSTVPVTVWIMSTSNFICWETRQCPWRAWGWEDRTNLEGGIFHDAEGCAGYIAVFFSEQAGTLYPDVSVTRHPAAQSTGACR
jgi:hypothetical protein